MTCTGVPRSFQRVCLLGIGMLGALLAVNPALAEREPAMPGPGFPTGSRGTVEFVMRLERVARSGLREPATLHRLVTFPGLGHFEFSFNRSSPEIAWRWEQRSPYRDVVQGFPQWPSPETYHVLFTWDADRGQADLYLNGVRTRERGARFEKAWSNSGKADRFEVPEGPISATEVRMLDHALEEESVRRRVPAELLGRHGDLLLEFPPPAFPVDIGARRGDLLHDLPLASAEQVSDWVMEGPGRVEFRDGWMHLSSERPDDPDGRHGNFVHWAPWTLPPSFVAEWEVRMENDPGLLIVFFAADSEGGCGIFAEGLKKRDGTFSHYNNGDITCYHISYYSNPAHEPGRTTSNLRKNPGAMMVYQGPIGIPVGSRRVHAVQLAKLGPLVQLSVDGRVVVNWRDDDSVRFGDPYGAGAFGLRQMQWTRAAYRNLRIWSLREHPTVSP